VSSVALAVASLALFGRAAGYYVGSGPHDGEDLPSFVVFLAGSAVLFTAVLIFRGARPGRRRLRLIGLCLSGLLLVMTSAWWALNVMLERWAS
jgi:hypothetical protein